MRRWSLALVAGLAALAAFVPASPVAAHASLISSSPAASSVLADPPTQIALQFDEAVEAATASVQLFDQSYHRVTLGAPARLNGDPNSIVASVPTTDDGTFAVVWRVTSVDGHVVSGAFSYQVGAGAGVDATALIDQVRNGAQSPPVVRQLYGVARGLGYVGLSLVLGGGVLALGVSGARQRRLRRWMQVGGVAAVVGALGSLGLYGVTTIAGRFGDLFGADAWSGLTDTQTGKALVLRLALVLCAAPLVWGLRLSSSGVWRSCALVVAIGLVLTFPLAGHDASLSPEPLWVALGALHTAGVLLWMGGLLGMTLGGGVWFGGRDEADEAGLADGADGADELRAVSMRFSSVSLVAVPVVVLTGVIETLKLAGGIDDLTSTTWGRVLLVKVVLAVAVMAAGGVSRWLLHERGPSAMRRTVAMEAVVGVVVLSLAAGLVGLPPRPGPASRTFSTTLTQAGLLADVTLTPGHVGQNEVHVVITPQGGSLKPVTSVSGRMTLPSRNIPESPITMTSLGPNHWTGTITLPYSGEWTLSLLVEPAPGSSLLLSTKVTIP